MRIENREIIAEEGKYIAKVNTNNFFTRCTLLQGETEKDFYEVTKEEKEELEGNELSDAKAAKIAEIEAYDTSDAVNSFTYKGIKMWFAKADRVGLRNSLNIEKRNGRKESTMWFGDTPLNVDIDEGLQLLDAIELYALDCYNVTASHKAEVMELRDVPSVGMYDVTKGYPTKLNL